MVPGDRLIISIGYKYNLWGVLSFIITKDTCSTKAGIAYLSNYPCQFVNVAICPVAGPLVMSKFFGYVYEVGSQIPQQIQTV